MTATALASGLAAVVSLVCFVVLTVALALLPVVAGGVALLGLVPLAARLTGLHRRLTGRLLQADLTASYDRAREADPVRRLGRWARDNTRWRDFSYLAFDGTGGLVMSGIVVVLAGAPFFYLTAPLTLGDPIWWWLLPVAGLAAGLWWLLTPILLRARFTAGAAVLGWSPVAALEQEVSRVAASRAETVDSAAAELRRIERDLHDGVQARIASLGMNLGLAEVLMREDPAAAEELVTEARRATTSVLEDLRTVVRGMHPPVLADRGLDGAVQALALDVAVPVTVATALPGRAPAPVESAVYFAVAEALANVVKHSGATRAWVQLAHRDGVLTALVGDDGQGGADPGRGTGLAGITRRLGAFDGTLQLVSPAGGPTTLRMEVPCALSSSRTPPSSGTA
ncbi:sensor histidine kinase [Modestobacter versicolor]|uniref:histidine kinase n=1 Tax=Modestobacter versicolor TaxID=429133 RepID=A0A323VD03_9ACTN|nr:sensor histidine kinase [Modestobacter versicolor]